MALLACWTRRTVWVSSFSPSSSIDIIFSQLSQIQCSFKVNFSEISLFSSDRFRLLPNRVLLGESRCWSFCLYATAVRDRHLEIFAILRRKRILTNFSAKTLFVHTLPNSVDITAVWDCFCLVNTVKVLNRILFPARHGGRSIKQRHFGSIDWVRQLINKGLQFFAIVFWVRDKVDHHSQFCNRGSGYLVSRQFNLSVLYRGWFLYPETKLCFPATREISGAIYDFSLILMAMCLDFTWSARDENQTQVWTRDFRRAPDWDGLSRDLCVVIHRARHINAIRFFVQRMMNNACHQRPLFAFKRKSFFQP